MKMLAFKVDKCVGCGECMKACSKAFFKKEDPSLSAIQIYKNNTINLSKKCTQCGECIPACPGNALKRNQTTGVVMLDKNLCVGCLACIGYCTEHNMFYHNDYNEPIKCIACGICVNACKNGALSIVESKEEA